MDKFIIISISVRLRNLKQYPDWFIDLSLPLTHTVTEFCAVAFILPITISYWLLSYHIGNTRTHKHSRMGIIFTTQSLIVIAVPNMASSVSPAPAN